VKVGIVGCGFVCHQHLRALGRLPAVEVVGLCDRQLPLARSVADMYGVPQAHDGMGRLLEAARPDVLHILTPPQSHCRLAVQALEAGCHVLVEKPMAMNEAEAEAMCEASRRTGRRLGVAHNYLFAPALVDARAVIARGGLGEVVSAAIHWRMSSFGPAHRPQAGSWMEALPGGAFQEVMPHPVYLMAALMGRLSPLAATVAGGEAGRATEFGLLLSTDRGPATLALSLRSNPVRKVVRVDGTQATLEVDLATSVLVHTASDADGMVARARVNLATARQIAAGTATNALLVTLGRLPRGHETLIERFYAALASRGALPVSAEEGLATVAVLDRIWSLLPSAASPEPPA
jgi:predicted dehydrogenase